VSKFVALDNAESSANTTLTASSVQGCCSSIVHAVGSRCREPAIDHPDAAADAPQVPLPSGTQGVPRWCVQMPPDRHVHSEWSWDASDGSMERTCARAIALGLSTLAFTEHVDRDSWRVPASDTEELEESAAFISDDGVLSPPAFDSEGYHGSLQRCRDLFPSLKLLSGVELGQPHWHHDATRQLLDDGQFDVVLGSLHGLMVDGEFQEMPSLFGAMPANDVMAAYLQEVVSLIQRTDTFEVLAHVDYATRYWPTEVDCFDPAQFEEEFRAVFRARGQ
jgi:histidinol-phosphatase (PHP family)